MDDAIGLLTRGYRLSSHIWQRVEPGRRAAPMTLLGRDAWTARVIDTGRARSQTSHMTTIRWNG